MNYRTVKSSTMLLAFLLSCFFTFAQDKTSKSLAKGDYKLKAVAELGFLGVFDHKIQFGNNGTYFDYRKDGGQDVLFPIIRPSLELEVKKRNTFIFLIQPLKIESQVYLNEDVVVDDLLYPATSSVKLLYNFPFYRFSYLREVMPNNDAWSLGIGGTIQIRNATISFESLDGERFRTNRDVGIVPAFKIRSRYQFSDRAYTELEADGIYAPVSYLNGSDTEIVGAILDASFRGGIEVTKEVDAFLNLRYLGGGAVGTSNDTDGPSDGYVKNWLHFGTVSAGFAYSF
ncbi:MAG: hypothetical protein KJP21_05210 [Bacteroidia bacterium]|nr:hypothetical protein [Bacteroidia bacterium]